MLNPPRTKEEAKARGYVVHWWAWMPGFCAYAIPEGSHEERQCSRDSGHGPDGLYCKQHAKMVEKTK